MMRRHPGDGRPIGRPAPGRIWVYRRKPVWIKDGAPWAVLWADPIHGFVRVRFYARHTQAVAFGAAVAQGLRALTDGSEG